MATIRSTEWLLRDPSDDSSALLFVLPYLGAGASMFCSWPRWFGSVEICPVQLPGREDRLSEPPIGTYDELCDRMVEALAPFLDRPFAFFGHCASAYLGLEASLRTMRVSGRAPVHLVVSSMFAPQEARAAPILSFDQNEVTMLAADLVTRRHGNADPEILEMAVEAITADLDVYRKYARVAGNTPIREVPCPISVIGWDQDGFIPLAKLEAWMSDAPQTDIIVLRGDHWTFLEARSDLQTLLETLLAG